MSRRTTKSRTVTCSDLIAGETSTEVLYWDSFYRDAENNSCTAGPLSVSAYIAVASPIDSLSNADVFRGDHCVEILCQVSKCNLVVGIPDHAWVESRDWPDPSIRSNRHIRQSRSTRASSSRALQCDTGTGAR